MFQFTRLTVCFQSGLCVRSFSYNTGLLWHKFPFVSCMSLSAVESTFLLDKTAVLLVVFK